MGTIHRTSPQKPFSWEVIQIGDEYGPVVGAISDQQIKNHAYAVDDYGEWYLRDSPFGGRIGHPTLLADDIRTLYSLGYATGYTGHSAPIGLHTRSDMEFLKPVRLGEEVTIRGRNVEKYQKRGANYRVLEGEVVDSAGEVLVRSRAVELVGYDSNTRVGQATGTPSQDRITGEVPAGAPVATRASADVPEGAALPSLVKSPTLEQSVIFSAFPWNWVEGGARDWLRNHHSVPEASRSRGRPDVLVQGLVPYAYISELCTDFFGPSWLTTGRLSASFVRPVIVRDVLTASAMVKRRLEEGAQLRLELDVWCKNQRGEMVAVGRASAQVG